MDVDSESSFESLSLPRTLEPAAALASDLPAKLELDFSANPHAHADDFAHASRPHHQRTRSSVLSLLRSFPIPHFHSQPHVATPAGARHPPASHAVLVRA